MSATNDMWPKKKKIDKEHGDVRDFQSYMDLVERTIAKSGRGSHLYRAEDSTMKD